MSSYLSNVKSFFNFVFIDFRKKERKGEREKNINLLFHLCVHWLLLGCALTRDRTHNLGLSGCHSNQLSYWPGLQCKNLQLNLTKFVLRI